MDKKRDLAREAREAIANLCAAPSNKPHVRDGLRLAAVVAHFLPFNVWTTMELETALHAAGLHEQANALAPPRQPVAPQIVDEFVEEPVPTLKRNWLRSLFG